MTQTNGAHPHLIVEMGAVVFVALVVLGAGALSYATDTDPIAVPGLGAVPGVLAIAVATACWLAVMLPAARRRPGLALAVVAGVAAALGQLLTLIVLRLGDIATGLGLAQHLLASGFSAVTAGAGLLAAVGVAVALRGGSGPTPRWPWENREPEE